MAEAILEQSDSLIDRVKEAVLPLDREVKVVKKDGTTEDYCIEKIVVAVNKSAKRVLVNLTAENFVDICNFVTSKINEMGTGSITMTEIHSIVECALQQIDPQVALSYRNYRNYKQDFVGMLDKVYQESQRIMYLGDKENSNIDSTLVATKRSLTYNELSKELYKKFFLNKAELQAVNDGYIYVHDMSARLNTTNCCLFDIAEVLNGGFEMGNIWYNEPQSLDVAFDVIGDIVMSASSQQYGGFTLPEIDTVLVKYAEKSYNMYYEEALDLMSGDEMNDIDKLAHEYAMKKVQKDFEQGFQGWEYKFNTVGSSRGDYPFITVTSGLETNKFGIMCNKAMYKVRMNGQGKKGNKKPVLFPKIVFLYDKELHGEGGVLREVYDAGIACSQRAMYPDWLSMSGEGYIASMYKKYKKVISPMGCFKGDHVLGFMQQDNPFAQSIERTWDWLSSTVPVKTQIEGQPHKYIDVSNLNFKVWDTAKQDYVKVNTFIRNVQDNWVNVKLSNGRYLDVTSDHPFETENRGVVQAKDLVLGDKIKANYGAPTFTESGEINNSLAWLYGAMLCDGCYQNYSVFASFGVDEEDVIDKFIGAFQENYKLTPEVKLQKRGKKGTYYDVRVKSSFTRSLKSLINEFTSVFGGVQKIHRHIPSFIWSSNRENKLHFLAGMFDADGSIRYDDGLASLGSTNHELAYEQMYLIQSLGMPCKIRKNYYKGKQNSDKYRVAVDFYPTAEFIECLTSQKKVNNFAGEKHFKNTPDVVEVIGLDMVEGTDYAYDLSTESAHFEVNGVYSHNCRAFLSPWYERGGMEPADENDVPVFTGRFNIGAVSLHLPMIFMKAKEEGKDFYTVLDYYLEMIRGLHLRTYEYLGEMKASINPLAFCEGGFYGGHLGYNEKIKPILKSATASFGITALNELQRLYNGKSIYEDGKFTLEVMEYINKKVTEFKKLDGRLYAIYGTPAESLCFSGNTLVSTVSGYKPISEIKVGDLVYSYNEKTKTIELKPVVAAKQTQEHAVVVKVTTDNGQEFICTPEHPFAVRRVHDLNKSNRIVSEYIEYIPASELKPGMRLKSKRLYIDRNGRAYFNSSNIKNYRHRINATYKFGSVEGYEVHHIDEDRTNDALDNLQLLSKKEHRRLHGNLVDYQFTSESIMGERNPFYGKKHTKEALELNRKAHMKDSVERYSLDMKHLQHFECLDDVTKFGFTRHLAKLACCGERQLEQGSHYYKDSYWFYTKDCKELLEENHKVVSVKYLKKLIPVYNLTVEDNHNYYVGGEEAVLVHNCEKQVYQFRDKYGIIKDVSDRLYVSNSFHCHVTEDITPIEKQNSERRFWELLNGGKIQYVKYPISYNKEAVETLVDRAMELGFYEGVNLELSYCDDCGHEELNMDVCPKCGSKNLTKISRMNGYLSYSRIKGDTRLNKGKMAELAERRSM